MPTIIEPPTIEFETSTIFINENPKKKDENTSKLIQTHEIDSPKHMKMNKDLFKKILNLCALQVPASSCSRIMNGLRKYPNCLLDLPKTRTIVDIPLDNGRSLSMNQNKENERDTLQSLNRIRKDFKYILMHPDIKGQDSLTDEVSEFLRNENVNMEWKSYSLTLSYDFWSSDQILRAVLPGGVEIPSSFESIGHIAHLNLRENLLPYKHIIGQVILDKNKHIKTVVNKVDSIDHTFRFFKMEVLAGEDNFFTELRESNCSFQMDYSKVYWNSRLQGEHTRLVSTYFKKGQVICDVFGGIGPFAIPAAKNSGCFVFANDLNPVSFEYLVRNIEKNKVEHKVLGFNMDGREFIRKSQELVSDDENWTILESKRKTYNQHKHKTNKNSLQKDGKESVSRSIPPLETEFVTTITNNTSLCQHPSSFDHYVMNLPATAIEFLDAFRGLYSNSLVSNQSKKPLPIVHCYCFSSAENMERDVIERASQSLGFPLSKEEDIIDIHRVRDVAPKKEMLCISFKLPKEVAYGNTKTPLVHLNVAAHKNEEDDESMSVHSSSSSNHKRKVDSIS